MSRAGGGGAAPLILLTRPRAQSEAFAERVAAAGWRALIWPVIEIRDLLEAAPDAPPGAAFVFTSARAVESLTRFGPPPARAYCVGPATATAARRAGFIEVIEAGGDARSLIARLKADRPAALIHLRGRHVAADLVAALRVEGINVTEKIAYEARPAGPPDPETLRAVEEGGAAAAAFFSPRSARLFAEAAPMAWRPRFAEMRALAISAAAAAALSPLGFGRVEVASAPNSDAILDLLRRGAA
ncbi:MAG: uroporphyrinogen-III synthase [Pikeienuella sp.]